MPPRAAAAARDGGGGGGDTAIRDVDRFAFTQHLMKAGVLPEPKAKEAFARLTGSDDGALCCAVAHGGAVSRCMLLCCARFVGVCAAAATPTNEKQQQPQPPQTPTPTTTTMTATTNNRRRVPAAHRRPEPRAGAAQAADPHRHLAGKQCCGV
jgi:hypothetical protein